MAKAQSLGLIKVEKEKSDKRSKSYASLTKLGLQVSHNLTQIEIALRQNSAQLGNG